MPGRCIECGACAEVCPRDAIEFIKGDVKISAEKCDQCLLCVEECPSGTLNQAGKKISSADLLEELFKDRIFFEESGGGVTFSGGEPLSQPIFLQKCLALCRNNGLHTCVDTSGYASKEVISRIATHTDLFLYDLKHMNDKRHLEITGVSNKTIIENLIILADMNKRVWIRIPLIPGMNDDDENITRTASFISSIGKEWPVSILPYHATGRDKYSRIFKIYTLTNMTPPDKFCMEIILQKIASFGLNVKIGG